MKKTKFMFGFLLVLFVSVFAVLANADGKMPVAYYTFDFGNLNDYSGNGYNARGVGGRNLTYEEVDGRGYVLELNNKGLKRDTNASGFRIPTDGLTDADAFTLLMDVYVETDGGNQVWFDLSRGKSSTDSHHYIVGLLNAGSGTYGINSELSTAVFTPSSKVRIYNRTMFDKAGTWARLAYVNNGGLASVYLDGVLVGTGNHKYSVKDMLTVDGVTLTVGMPTFWNDLSLDAKLDNVAVYDYALTAEELADPTLPETPKPDGPITPDAPIGDVYFPGLGANGLLASYYALEQNDLSFGIYKTTYLEKNIDYPDMSKQIANRASAVNYVAARWEGRIAAPEDGNYTFSAYADNGFRLYIDGETVLDWWENDQNKEQLSEEIYLTAGQPHEFVFEWFEYNGGCGVVLRWESDRNVIKKPIPASAFYLPADSGMPVIDGVDVSAAKLDMNEGALGGTLALTGTNLDCAEAFELVYQNGLSATTPLYLTPLSVSASAATLAFPADMPAGYFCIRPHYRDVISHSDDGFTVRGLQDIQSRTEFPDPSWQRADWQNLNGWWDFDFDEDEVGLTEAWYLGTREYSRQINVPFGWESTLSGIGADEYQGQAWYNRTFTPDAAWLAEGRRVFLHFGAVDAKCIVYINGTEVGSHNGGFTPFEIDVTSAVTSGENTLTVWVEDKASHGDNSYPAVIGKQGHNAPCGYTHTSGIWQTVYLEGRNAAYIESAQVHPDYKAGAVQYDLSVISDTAKTLTVEFDFESKLWDGTLGEDVATGSTFTYAKSISLTAGENTVTLPKTAVANAKLWSDREPNLYYGTITLKDAGGNVIDRVSTYFGIREVYTAVYDGRDYEYIYLNGAPIFLAGVLDQGFWRDGIYTARDEEALKFDIAAMKELGFNMIRKHLKVEEPLQYYWCDKLGMFVWQDMPHASAMNAASAGAEAKGRAVYESTLEEMLRRDYNKPSIMAIMLFNETWGINHKAPTAADGMNTIEWMQSLYYKVKAYNSGLIVEDMSPLWQNHIQPTDLNTFHMYPITYKEAVKLVEKYANNAYEGSPQNFWPHVEDNEEELIAAGWPDFRQEKEPLLNSEYGGVGVNSGDRDVSLCFKYQTDLMRMIERYNGYVYTEPYDIEYERNGIYTYDRRAKLFPYDEIAFGGDMTMADLNQPNHVGVYAEPAKVSAAGSVYAADAVASNWSGEHYTNAILHWRLDAVDAYGNNFTTGVYGQRKITYAPYTAEHYPLSFTLPDKTCVCTLTVWVEENGEKLAKNFVNIIVNGVAAANAEAIGENVYALRSGGGEFEGAGALTLTYALPENFDLSSLTSLCLVAEVSSVKASRLVGGIPYSKLSQSAEGDMRPSDMTLFVNGIEMDTVCIPDNPRDIRGTLTFNYSSVRNSSAEDFGYLVNVAMDAGQMDALRAAIANDGEIRVTYTVKADAENQNGLRIYDDKHGRYAVKPTVILNPETLDADRLSARNYRVSASLADGESISLRGGAATVLLRDGVLSLGDAQANVGAGTHTVSVRVFDTHYQVYADNDPVPVIDVYLTAAVKSTAVSTSGILLSVTPETYGANAASPLLYLAGDIDGSGLVTLYDTLSIARALVDGISVPAGDVNGDGKISLADVLSAMKLLAN